MVYGMFLSFKNVCLQIQLPMSRRTSLKSDQAKWPWRSSRIILNKHFPSGPVSPPTCRECPYPSHGQRGGCGLRAVTGADLGWRSRPYQCAQRGWGGGWARPAWAPVCVTRLSIEWNAARRGRVLAEDQWRAESSPLPPPHRLCQAAASELGLQHAGATGPRGEFRQFPQRPRIPPFPLSGVSESGEGTFLLPHSPPPLMFLRPASGVSLLGLPRIPGGDVTLNFVPSGEKPVCVVGPSI